MMLAHHTGDVLASSDDRQARLYGTIRTAQHPAARQRQSNRPHSMKEASRAILSSVWCR